MDIPEITSRGDDEERVFAISNALNVEEHLTDIIAEHPEQAIEISRILDEVRENRQKLVNLWSNGKVNKAFWCPTKHLLNTDYHLREMLMNASRHYPQDVPKIAEALSHTVRQRKAMSKLFLSGNGESSGCERCEADLGKANVEAITQHLNMPSTNGYNRTSHTILEKLNRGEKSMDLKELGLINGGQLLGKGFVWLGDEVDSRLGKAGNPLLKRPSFYMNVVGGAALQLAALKLLRNKPKAQLAAVLMGSHALTKAVDYAREAAAGTSRARFASRAVPAAPRQALPYSELIRVDM